ncbi:MAG: hypothetical protein RSF40_08930 [Oscillospiraceae bacterium]
MAKAKKEDSKISINQMDKLLPTKTKDDNKIPLWLKDSEGKDTLEIIVTPILSVDDTVSFVESVAEALFVKDTYLPSVRNLVYNKALLAYYTNLRFDMTDDKINELVYQTTVCDQISETIMKHAGEQMCDVHVAIDEAIEFKKQQILSEQRQLLMATNMRIDEEQNDILKSSNALIEAFNSIITKFNDINFEQLVKDVNTVANTPDKERVDNILSFQQKLEEAKATVTE